jgi:hypothetical protein
MTVKSVEIVSIERIEAVEARVSALEKLCAGIALCLTDEQRLKLRDMLGDLLTVRK